MKKILFDKRKVRIFFLHAIVLVVFGMLFLKYAEEIVKIKERIRHEIRYQKNETCVDFTNYPVIAHDDGAWYENTPLIYHGGGGIDGCDYTNSKEALEQTLAAGHRYVEIDFLYTSDAHLVCAHYWSSLYNDEKIPNLEEFQSLKIFGKYTSMTAEQLIAYMKEYEDLHIIIDTKEEDYQKVILDLVELSSYDRNITDRFIIQLYEEGTKEQFQKIYPFKDENFLFTTYKYSTEYTNKIMNLCYEENIAVITIPYDAWDKETIEVFRKKGFIIYEHTVNRPHLAQASLEKGISGFYTDYLTEDDLKH